MDTNGKIYIEHSLLGSTYYKHKVDEEHECFECIHNKVCRHDNEEFCLNYEFGTSQGKGCHSCLHRFTRWDSEHIPCFICKYFQKENNDEKDV